MTNTLRATTASKGGARRSRSGHSLKPRTTPSSCFGSEPLYRTAPSNGCQSIRRTAQSSARFEQILENVNRLKDRAFLANRLAIAGAWSSRSSCYRVRAHAINWVARSNTAFAQDPSLGLSFTRSHRAAAAVRNTTRQQLIAALEAPERNGTRPQTRGARESCSIIRRRSTACTAPHRTSQAAWADCRPVQ